jgi:hypothetical protein
MVGGSTKRLELFNRRVLPISIILRMARVWENRVDAIVKMGRSPGWLAPRNPLKMGKPPPEQQ